MAVILTLKGVGGKTDEGGGLLPNNESSILIGSDLRRDVADSLRLPKYKTKKTSSFSCSFLLS